MLLRTACTFTMSTSSSGRNTTTTTTTTSSSGHIITMVVPARRRRRQRSGPSTAPSSVRRPDHHRQQQPQQDRSAQQPLHAPLTRQRQRPKRREKSSHTAPTAPPLLLLLLFFVISCCCCISRPLLFFFSDDSSSPGNVVHGFPATIRISRRTTLSTAAPRLDLLRQRRAIRASSSNSDAGEQQQEDDSNKTGSDLAKLEQQLQQQQEQINSLLQVLQQQQTTTTTSSEDGGSELQSTTAAATTQLQQQQQQQSLLPPLKAMLFIDGTWLYYSIHERPARDCPLIQKYGRGWQWRYRLDWARLPHILCQQLGGLIGSRRTVEIVRASVYTSYKADTNPQSHRYKLFEDLRAANYDVHMMETVGRSEKCVDIQLAVEMLHYATIGNGGGGDGSGGGGGGSYDVALLLTGDKDFIPAMVRTRQKGKALGLVSMKRGCNRALTDTPGLRDFDVLWLEDYLDDFVVPIPESEQLGPGGPSAASSKISTFTLYKVMHDFVQTSEYDRVSSRDMGRYLKFLHIGGKTLLDEIKENYVGLHNFLTVSGHFQPEHDPQKEDSTDKSYWIGMLPGADARLLREARATKFSPAEREFFQKYNLVALLRAEKDRFYQRTRLQPSPAKNAKSATAAAAPTSLSQSNGPVNGESHPSSAAALPGATQQLQQQQQDYFELTVSQLKAICRENGLPVSGVKAALVERIQTHFEESPLANNSSPPAVNAVSSSTMSNSNDVTTTPALEHLQSLVEEYLHARGGRASSRDIGRYLVANRSSSVSDRSALQELKAFFGGLRVFVEHHSDRFCIVECAEEESTHEYEFVVGLVSAVNQSTSSSSVD